MSDEKKWALYIRDMIYAIDKILKKTEGLDYTQVVDDEDLRDILDRRFQILGEAARHIPEEVKAKHADIEWSKITGMRHFVTHEYRVINYQIVWDVITDHLPDLKTKLEVIDLPDSA